MSLASRFARLGSAAALTAALGLAQAEALHAQTDSSWLAERMSTWYRTTTRHAPGAWGIAVADGSGRLLWSVQPDEPMVPASTVKLFTTGFARTMLGGDARRSTRVMGEGQLDAETGEWVGILVAQELEVGGLQVLALALVLPAEEAFFQTSAKPSPPAALLTAFSKA